jgi:hypothetical protein
MQKANELYKKNQIKLAKAVMVLKKSTNTTLLNTCLTMYNYLPTTVFNVITSFIPFHNVSSTLKNVKLINEAVFRIRVCNRAAQVTGEAKAAEELLHVRTRHIRSAIKQSSKLYKETTENKGIALIEANSLIADAEAVKFIEEELESYIKIP